MASDYVPYTKRANYRKKSSEQGSKDSFDRSVVVIKDSEGNVEYRRRGSSGGSSNIDSAGMAVSETEKARESVQEARSASQREKLSNIKKAEYDRRISNIFLRKRIQRENAEGRSGSPAGESFTVRAPTDEDYKKANVRPITEDIKDERRRLRFEEARATNPFSSKGFVARGAYGGMVITDALSGKGWLYRADTGSKFLNRTVERTVSNPYEAALYLTGAGKAVGLAGKGARSALGAFGFGASSVVFVQRTAAGAIELTGEVSNPAEFRGVEKALGAEFDVVSREARRRELELLGKGGFNIPLTDKKVSPRLLAAELNPVFGSEAEFKRVAREEFKNRGLSGRELDNAVIAAVRDRRVRSGAEFVGFVAGSARVELLGRESFGYSFGKSQQFIKGKEFNELFRYGFKNIAPLGLIEGATQQSLQQDLRLDRKDFKDIGLAGGAGFVSAGLIGGAVVGFTMRPKSRAVTSFTGNILDVPYEVLGDKTADLVEYLGRKTGRSLGPRVAVVTPTPADVFSLGAATEPLGSAKKVKSEKVGKGRKKTGAFDDFLKFSPNSFSVTEATIPTPADIFSDQFVPSDTPPNTPADTTTKEDTIIDTQIDSVTDTVTDALTETSTYVNTNTPANTATIITSVPVLTPQIRTAPFPFFPPSGDVFGGGGGGVRGAGLAFVNELNVGLGLLSGLGGGRGEVNLIGSGGVKKKKGKKGKKGKKANEPLLFGNVLGGDLFNFDVQVKKGKNKGGSGILGFKMPRLV